MKKTLTLLLLFMAISARSQSPSKELLKAYFVPKGLTVFTLSMLEKELQPLIKLIEKSKATSDIFASKETTMHLFSYMYNHFGTPLFIDADKLSAIVADQEADKELTSNLSHCYMINKFYAYAKDIKDPKQFAFDQMRIAFKKSVQIQPDIPTGELQMIFK